MARPKIVNVKSGSSVKKISVKIPLYMKEEIPIKMIRDGYNMRQKSKWIADAVEKMISRDGWEGVLLSQAMVKTDILDVITLPNSLCEKINKEVLRIKQDKPFLNPNTSTIIRAAIQRKSMGIEF